MGGRVKGARIDYADLDELVDELFADILAGLERRLAFEAWADCGA